MNKFFSIVFAGLLCFSSLALSAADGVMAEADRVMIDADSGGYIRVFNGLLNTDPLIVEGVSRVALPYDRITTHARIEVDTVGVTKRGVYPTTKGHLERVGHIRAVVVQLNPLSPGINDGETQVGFTLTDR